MINYRSDNTVSTSEIVDFSYFLIPYYIITYWN